MAKKETLQEFQQHRYNLDPTDTKKDVPFNIFRFEDCADTKSIEYSRRDFFKIALMNGDYTYHYGDKSLEVTGTTLVFFNPEIPYTFEHSKNTISGQFCIFTESFFNEHFRGKIKNFAMFAPGATPAYLLDEAQRSFVMGVFDKMHADYNSDYPLKYELILSYITELIHYALKLQPTEKLQQNVDANVRIAAVFNELLERQFPIDSIDRRFSLRSANDFAARMSIHVNHLNRAIKNATGKTTTNVISERLAGEAKALLKHTDWNIAEISYTLGFEDPANFNHFFKKQTKMAPSSFRN